jgi:hypothetical protein
VAPPGDAAVGTEIVTSLTVYDIQGMPIDATFTFAKTATDAWTVSDARHDDAGAGHRGDGQPRLGSDGHAAGLQPGAVADAQPDGGHRCLGRRHHRHYEALARLLAFVFNLKRAG